MLVCCRRDRRGGFRGGRRFGHDSPSMTAPHLSRPVGRGAHPQEITPALTRCSPAAILAMSFLQEEQCRIRMRSRALSRMSSHQVPLKSMRGRSSPGGRSRRLPGRDCWDLPCPPASAGAVRDCAPRRTWWVSLVAVCGSTAMVVTMHYAATAALVAAVRRGAGRDRGRAASVHAGVFGGRVPQPLLGAAEHRGGRRRRRAPGCPQELGDSAGEADSYVWSSLPVEAEGPMTLWLVPGGARRADGGGRVRWARPARQRVVADDRGGRAGAARRDARYGRRRASIWRSPPCCRCS